MELVRTERHRTRNQKARDCSETHFGGSNNRKEAVGPGSVIGQISAECNRLLCSDTINRN